MAVVDPGAGAGIVLLARHVARDTCHIGGDGAGGIDKDICQMHIFDDSRAFQHAEQGKIGLVCAHGGRRVGGSQMHASDRISHSVKGAGEAVLAQTDRGPVCSGQVDVRAQSDEVTVVIELFSQGCGKG